MFEVLQQFQDSGVEVAWVDPSMPSRGPLSSIFTFLDAWRAGRERRLVEGYRKGLYPDLMMREEMERMQEERATARQRLRELQTPAFPLGPRFELSGTGGGPRQATESRTGQHGLR